AVSIGRSVPCDSSATFANVTLLGAFFKADAFSRRVLLAAAGSLVVAFAAYLKLAEYAAEPSGQKDFPSIPATPSSTAPTTPPCLPRHPRRPAPCSRPCERRRGSLGPAPIASEAA